MIKQLPELSLINSLLSYDATTGILIWNKPRGGSAKQGSIAGNLDKDGYLVLKLKGITYRAHRVIWYMHYGTDPGELLIDHKNCKPADNRIDNLRLVDFRNNATNRGNRSDNTTGVKGVSLKNGKYVARVTINKIRKFVGNFHSLESAKVAIEEYRIQQGEYANHG